MKVNDCITLNISGRRFPARIVLVSQNEQSLMVAADTPISVKGGIFLNFMALCRAPADEAYRCLITGVEVKLETERSQK